MRSKGTVSYALKNSYKFGDFSGERMYNTAVLDGIMQKHSTNSSQVTVLKTMKH
jgi:hypothetical protein